jgi:transposase
MDTTQETAHFDPQALAQRVALLEAAIAQKDIVITQKEHLLQEKDFLLIEKETSISNLSASLEAEKFKYAQLQRMIFGSKRERFVSPYTAEQLRLEFEPKTIEIEEAVEAEREAIRVSYERKKARKPHPGRMPLPAHLPVVEIILEPEEDITGMEYIGKEITQELDYTPAKLQAIHYIRYKYITAEDDKANQRQVIAPLNRAFDKCIASAALMAAIFVDKFVYHLPYYRFLQRLSQEKVHVPKSTFESWVKLGAALIRPLYQVHRLYVFSQLYQQIDESPIKVQDSEKPGALHQGYMWVRYGPLTKTVLFEYYKGRSAKSPLSDLSTFKGYVQTDGYVGYTQLVKAKDITHLSCWVHARRYFDQALGNDQQRASKVLKLVQILYAIEALAREQNLTHEQRHALRLERSLPIINEIGSYIYNERDKVLPGSPIGKAFNYCANRWISLQNYLLDGMLEIDSNLIENTIRPLALGRKNYLFAGSHEAAENIAMFYSFFGTCKQHGIDPQKWLTYVFNNINATKASELNKLLPHLIDKNLVS